jgi:RNA polymerase sigma-B factor
MSLDDAIRAAVLCMHMATRDDMVIRHLPLARRLARRYSHSPQVMEDLTQVAALGLVRAAERFDPDRGVSFSSFAVPTILGELRRHFRDTRWAVHVPRELQERAQRVEREIERLTATLRREPRPREVAESLGMDVEDVLDAQGAFVAFDAQSLNAPVGAAGADGDSAGDLIGSVDGRYDIAEELASLEPALGELSERDRQALHLRFACDMTQAEIGRHLGVSQMQISRILRRALRNLRESACV